MNSNALSLATTTALTVSNLILATPAVEYGYMPQSGDEVAIDEGFVFDYEGDQTSTLSSAITDNATEENFNTSDNIALAPEKFTTTGFIGELNDIIPRRFRKVQLGLTKLWVLNGLLPQLSEAAQQAYNTAFQGYQAVENAQKAIASWGDNDEFGGVATIGSSGLETGDVFNDANQIKKTQSKQQVAYQKLYAYWQKRQAFTIQTPWAIMKNMYIEEIVARQSESTRTVTEFTVTFKMIRIATTAQTYKTNSTTFENQIAPAKDVGALSSSSEVPLANIL